MKSYEIVEHTNEVGLKLAAPSLEELFLGGVQGMAELLKEDSPNTPITKSPLLKIELKAPDSTSLLIDFLGKILARSKTNHVIYTAISFTKLTETEVSALLTGVKVEEFEIDIKAVSYQEADIIKDSRGVYQTMVMFDI